MIAGKPSREVIRMLGRAGWTAVRTRGSHTRWACPSGGHWVTVPDGHKTISPGVLRQIHQAMDRCDCTERMKR